MNANKRLREGSSSSSMSDISDSELSLKCIMEKLESIQQSLDSNFAEAMSEINSLRADVNASNICKEAYKLIVKKISSTPANSQTKWITDCGNCANSIKWDKSYNLPFYCTRETKLQTFQFKLLHRRIATNNYLYKIGISLTDSCTFCEQTTETLIHLFWECEFVQKFWQDIQYWLIQHQVKPQDFSLNLPTCLGLVDNTEDILLHHALLMGRYHIYSSKIKKTLPNLHIFSQTFLKCQEIEKCFAYKTNTVKKYNSKWNRFK